MSDETFEVVSTPMPKGKPGARPGGKKPDTRTLIALEVGQAFFTLDRSRWQTLSGACQYWGRKLGRKYATRQTDKGLGIWRIS